MSNRTQKSFIRSVMGYLSPGAQSNVLIAQNTYSKHFEQYLDRKAQWGIAQAKMQEYTRELEKTHTVADQQFLSTKIDHIKNELETSADQDIDLRRLYSSSVSTVNRESNHVVVVNVAEGEHKTVYINAPFTPDDDSLRARYTFEVDNSLPKIEALLALLGGEDTTLTLAQSPGRKAFGIEVKLRDLLTQKITAQWGVYDIPLVADLEVVQDADGNQLYRLPQEFVVPFVFMVEKTEGP